MTMWRCNRSGPLSPAVTDRVDVLAAAYGYPEPIREALAASVAALSTLRPLGVLLVGSGARGELTYRTGADGRLELFSDLEFFCFVDQNDPGKAEQARAGITEVELALRALLGSATGDGLFHIDWVAKRPGDPGRNARGLGWYEAGTAGALVLGPDRPYLGDVRGERVELGLVNQLCIIRLWWLLLYLPVQVLVARTGDALREKEREELFYIQVRNLLDVASIWLPNIDIFKTSYRSRADHVEGARLPGAEHLPTEFPSWLREATERKLEPRLEGDPLLWYERTIQSFEGLTGLLVRVPEGSGALDRLRHVRSEWSRRHPVPVGLRFGAYETVLRTRTALSSPRRYLRSEWDPNATALVFLLAAHRSAAAWLAGEVEMAEEALAWAADAFVDFTRAPLPDEFTVATEWVSRWHTLRFAFIPTFMRYFRKVRGRSDWIRSTMAAETQALT